MIRTREGFAALSAEWTSLLRRTQLENMSLDHSWLRHWLAQFPAEPFVILVHDEPGLLVAAAPLKISWGTRGLLRRQLRCLQFIGTEPTVYEQMRILIDRRVNAKTICRKIAKLIVAAQSDWDVLDLQFCRDRKQLGILLQEMHAMAFSSKLHGDMPIPVLRLPASPREYEDAFRKRGFRRDLRRVCNRLNRDFQGAPLSFEFLPAARPTPNLMESFFHHHIAYGRRRNIRSDFARYPLLAAFYQRVFHDYSSQQGTPFRVHFSRLCVGEIPLAYQIVLRQGDTFIVHLATYDERYRKYRPGILGMHVLIRHTIEIGGKVFQFGRGNESYKSLWTDQSIRLWSLRVLRGPWTAFLWNVDTLLMRLFAKNRDQRLKRAIPSSAPCP